MEYIILSLLFFAYGIIIGSFLNVCIYRLPRGEEVVRTRSHCMSCGSTLKWYELFPILSYILQKGRCRHCKEKLSIQYPLVELANGLVYVFIFVRMGICVESILFCLCASTLLVIAIIDARTYEIIPGCNIIIGILGIVRLLLDLPHWYEYIAGFFAVSVIFLLVYFITKGNGIGGGDIKLMAAAGLLLGWKNILLALAIGSITGSVIHLSLMKIKKKDRVLAFGPYLAFGIFVAMIFGEQIIRWYLAFCGLV